MLYFPSLYIPFPDGLTGEYMPNIHYLMFLVRYARAIGMIVEWD